MRPPLVWLAALFFASVLPAAAAPAPAASPSTGPFAALRWRSIGPAVSGGRLAAVAGTDADPGLYYVGSAGGGVWKTTNAGESWQPVFDGQRVASIGAVAIDPRNAQTVWVGTGEGNPRNDVSPGNGVYVTHDGAKTWQRVLALRNALITGIVIDPKDSASVLVGVLGDPFADSPDRGVYRTSDGGRTWTKTLYLGPRSGVSDLVSSRAAPNEVYAGMWEFRRTGWSLQSGGPQDGLYKSVDGGKTWRRLDGHGLPEGELGRVGLAVAPSDPQRVYALIQSADGLLWRSDDAGATWRKMSADTLIDERPFYFNHVFVDPTDKNHLWSVSVHLTVSTDGGKTFHVTGKGIHGDHHAMWIAANGKRIIEGNDGGVAFSMDGGASWAWDNVIPISQPYHVGYDRRNPYHICAPLQDNGVWCAPNDGLSERGLSASQWHDMGGGDGTWALPDPLDPHLIWSTSGGGNFAGEMEVFDTRTGEARIVSPYLRDQNVVDPKNLRYRFNWETPIAFDPFDPHVAYAGANVLFATRDRGDHWRVISPDLTRNDKAHQVVTGGLTLDGTGAETSDTILCIEPSHAARGEIWIGTDDGYVQLTRDGGKHWRNVTPHIAGSPFGRFASISPSVHDPATAYAVDDLHMTGDRTPHVYVTHDYGAHWTDVGAGLPRDDEARSVLLDPRNPQLVYVGLENGLWLSFDAGAQWQPFNATLPPVSVRQIALQPDADDLLLATHGRGIWILDDAAPLQDFSPQADRLFPMRAAYLWNEHTFFNTHVDGQNPPFGAIVTYWLRSPLAAAPAGVVRDARGQIVRHLQGLTGHAGMNRIAWDLAEDPPVAWKFAPHWNRGYDSGAAVLPGVYTVELHAGKRVLRGRVLVKQDPRTHYTQAQLRARQAMLAALFADFSRVDVALNTLSAVLQQAPLRQAVLAFSENVGLASRVGAAAAAAKRLLLSITQNPANDQDNDFLTDVLRERLQTQIDTFASYAPPTAAQATETAALHALAIRRLRAVAAFEAGPLHVVDAQLRALKMAPLTAASAPEDPRP